MDSRLMRVLISLIVLMLAGPALAQDWQIQHHDDGSFFTTLISPTGPGGFTLLCGERSPQGLSAMQTGNMEPDITPPDVLRMSFRDRDIGPPDNWGRPRQDVMIVIGTTGYQLNTVGWNEMFSQWEVDLHAGDPVFGAIARAPEFELRTNVSTQIVTSTDFATAFTRLTDHCQSMFAAIGTPWPSGSPKPPPTPPPAPTPARASAMRQIAESAIWQGCGGSAQFGPDAFLTGEIDGDGLPDVVLDWGAVQCGGFNPRPFCGASRCSADVYLSSAYHRQGMPESLLGLGVRLQPLNTGNMGVAVGGALSECHAIGQGNCEFLYYWNGFGLVALH